jgi:hypothetical protein
MNFPQTKEINWTIIIPAMGSILRIELNLKDETCLYIIMGKIGKLLQMELLDTYAFKTLGLQVRLLVGVR